MYVIFTYDVGVERVDKVLKIARVYLTWVQNSVLEGEITEANYVRFRDALLDVIDESTDSVTFSSSIRSIQRR